MRISIILVLGTIMVGLSLKAEPVWASSTSNAAADTLVRVGIIEYEKGRYQDAAHEFSKALMLDPEHKVAREYLAKMGVRKGLYSHKRTKEAQIVDLSRALKAHEDQLALLNSQKNKLESKFADLQRNYIARELESDLLQKKIDYTEDKQERHYAQIEDIKNYFGQESEELNSELIYQRQKLIDQHIEMDRMSKLLDLNEKNSIDALAKLDDMLQLQDRLINLQLEHQRLQKLASRQNALLADVYEQVDDYLYVRNTEVNDLQGEVIGEKMDLAKTQVDLVDRIDQIAMLLKISEQYKKDIDTTRAHLLKVEEQLKSLMDQQ